MPPKNKKKGEEEDLGLMKAARFGRVKNTLSMGFVGLPNVGKSSLSNLLAGAMHAEAANYVSFYELCFVTHKITQSFLSLCRS